MALENLAIWSIPPDWQEGVTETLEWLTPVLSSVRAVEQRFALRLSPRRSFEMTFKPRGSIRTLADMFVERSGGTDIYFPIWHDQNKLIATASSTTLTIASVDNTEFPVCPGVFIQGDTPFNYAVTEFISVSGNVITTPGGFDTWPIGTRIYPLVKGRIEVQPQAIRKADRAFQIRIKFSTTIPNPTTAIAVLSSYKDLFVLEREPNEVQDLSFEYSRLLAELDNQTGKRQRNNTLLWGSTVQQFAFFVKRRVDHTWFRGLLYTLQGRRNPLYVPTFFMDLDVTEDLSSSSITVKRCGYSDFAGPFGFRGRTDIVIILHDGTRLYREIVGSALIGDGDTENLTLNSGFSPAVPKERVKRISFLTRCRLDSDSIEIVHHTDSSGVATCTVNFREIVNEAA